MVVNDHRKLYPSVYRMKPGAVEVLEIPALQFIAHEGRGGLNGMGRPAEACWEIWKIVNQLKAMTKAALGYQFKLMPNEVVWHQEHENGDWSYTEMMQVPDLIDYGMYEEARANVEKRYRGERIPATRLVRIEQGHCAQKFHAGHYRETYRVVEEIEAFVGGQGYRTVGDRREIYLNPPECHPSPDRWETIVRVRVEKAVQR